MMTLYRTLSICFLVSAGFLFVEHAHAATAQLYANTDGSQTYVDTVFAQPEDTIYWQLVYSNSGVPISGVRVTMPDDLVFVSNTEQSGVSFSHSGQQLYWDFSPHKTTAVLSFSTAIKPGNELSQTHTYTVSYTTTGVEIASTNNTLLQIAPVVTGLSVYSVGDQYPTVIDVFGHGFSGVALSSILLSDGITTISGATSTSTPTRIASDTLITGLRITPNQLLMPGQRYYVILNTATSTGATFTTAADATETVQITVADGTEPILDLAASSYVHSTGTLTLAFNESLNTAETVLSNIELCSASENGDTLSLADASVSAGADATELSLSLTQSHINTIASWQTATTTLFAFVPADTVYDTAGNDMVTLGSCRALGSWIQDEIAPSVSSFSIIQDTNDNGYVRAGNATIRITLSEVASTTPQIAIDQQGTQDINATPMIDSGDHKTFTYDFLVTVDNGDAYRDGTAIVTISATQDYGGNTMVSDASYSFVIDTTLPDPPIDTLTAVSNGSTGMNLSWSPSYTDPDFDTYEIYYATASGVSSSIGTRATHSSLGNADTAHMSLTSLVANTDYYMVIYICDRAKNCSSKSNEAYQKTALAGGVLSPGGGGTTAPALTYVSVAKQIPATGGRIVARMPHNLTVSVSVPGSVLSGETILVSEPTPDMRINAANAVGLPLVSGDSIVSIVSSGSSAGFSDPVLLTLTFGQLTIPFDRIDNLSIAYFDETARAWVAIASTIDRASESVSGSTTHFTLFGLVYAHTTQPSAPVSEEGAVLGEKIGIYSNGTLLRYAHEPEVWLIENGQKHHIPSPEIFESRYHWSDIIILSEKSPLEDYTRGADVRFSEGSLVKAWGISSVYRVRADGVLSPIISEAVFQSLGYSFANVHDVEPNVLADYAVGDLITVVLSE